MSTCTYLKVEGTVDLHIDVGTSIGYFLEIAMRENVRISPIV